VGDPVVAGGLGLIVLGEPVLGLPMELCGCIDELVLSEPAAPMSELVGGGLAAGAAAAGAVAETSADVPVLACCAMAIRSLGEAFRYVSSWA